MAEEFWGWPDRYKREAHQREYWNWKPNWRLYDTAAPEIRFEERVRMYFYPASSDFRFYSPKLVGLGANKGDVVRIARLAEPSAEFECAMAKVGTPLYDKWTTYCTQPIQNSPGRRFGYA